MPHLTRICTGETNLDLTPKELPMKRTPSRALAITCAFLCLASLATAQELSLEQLRLRADKGDVKAQVELGLRYFIGRGARQDDDQAERWLQRAAAQDDLKAYVALGWFYINASRPKTDRERGVALYRVAAERGDIEAMYNLAEQYNLGRGVPTNESHAEAAVRWFRKVADFGDPQAMNELAHLYEDGRGVRRDYIEAYKWWSIAVTRATPPDRQRYKQDRDLMAGDSMTPNQIGTARLLAREWLSAFAKRK